MQRHADLVSQHRDELVAQGYSIMPEALPVDLCDALLAEFDRMRGVWRRSLVQEFHGRNTVRYFDLLNAAPVFQRAPSSACPGRRARLRRGLPAGHPTGQCRSARANARR